MTRKISAKTQPPALKHLTKNSTEASTKKDIADTQTETFSANSSFQNSNRQFLTFKTIVEKQTLNFKSDDFKNYNPFTSAELAIQSSQMKFTRSFWNIYQKIFGLPFDHT